MLGVTLLSSWCSFVFQDIMISGAPKPEEISNAVKRTNENHLANRLRYSLRVSVIWLANPAVLHNTRELGCWYIILQVYTSVLYLELPDYFRIILRGQEVKRHYIATDIIYPECISYKPQICGKQEVCPEIRTTFCYLHNIARSLTLTCVVLILLFSFLHFVLALVDSGWGYYDHWILRWRSNN